MTRKEVDAKVKSLVGDNASIPVISGKYIWASRDDILQWWQDYQYQKKEEGTNERG